MTRGADSRADGVPALRIRMLGTFEVHCHGHLVPDAAWRGRTARNLVKLLCLAPEQQLHREQLLDRLWPDLEPRAAANNLRSTLHVARRALEPAGTPTDVTLLASRGSMVALCEGGSVEIDVVQFEDAVATATAHPSIPSFQAAAGLYGGDLLPEDRYADWADPRRDILRTSAVAMLTGLAALLATERPGDAIVAYRRALTLEPAHEEAHVGLMRIHASIGERQQALTQYELLRKALREELDVEPELASEALYGAILAGQFPARAETRKRPGDRPGATGHLPNPLTSFVGRLAELHGIADAFRMTRLVTLAGPGGSGKTRLAIEVGRSITARFPDGVWFVDLSSIVDADHLPQAIASVLGVPEQLERPAIAAVVDHLRPMRALVILDNCEHVVVASSRVSADLLAACPDLVILSTSREALRVDGELVWRLAPLGVPELGDGHTPFSVPDAMGHDAVRLFIERARFVQPGLELTDANVGAIVDICRRVDGLPLALELAAARVNVVSLAQLAERLADTLQVLTGGSRTADARHQTLRATLTWSYDLLLEPERRLLERASVFVGGWTLDAIENVVTGEDIRSADVLGLIAQLIDKSLVVTAPAASGRLRYRMLEPVRQFCFEQLLARSEDHAVAHRRHAHWFRRMAEDGESGLRTDEQEMWLDRLDADHDNMRAALAWSFEHDHDVAVQMCSSLWRYWYVHGHLLEGREWVERAYGLADALPRPTRAKALLVTGQVRTALAEYADVEGILDEAISLFRCEDGHTRGLRDAYAVLAMALGNQGKTDRARAYVLDGLELEREADDAWGISRCLGNLAELAYADGDHSAAAQYWEEGLLIDEALGDTRSAAITVHNIGEVLRAQGDLVGARSRFERSRELFRSLDFQLGLAHSLSSGAEVLVELEEPSAAGVLLQGVAVARRLAHPTATAATFEVAAKLLAVRGDWKNAARMFGAGDSIRGDAEQPLTVLERAKFEPWLTAARDAVDQPTREAWAAGGGAPVGQLLDELEVALGAAAPRGPSSVDRVAVLTDRELQIAALIAEGLTNRRIAEILDVARPTVDKHVSNLLRKLDVASRREVSAWFEASGATAPRH